MKKILIIDDEQGVCESVKMILERTNEFEVVTAANGDKGIEIACDCKPDLVLLDILMPDKDGTEIANLLLKNPVTKNIPIIFLTGAVKKDEVDKKTGKIGGNLFISKMTPSDELVRQIKERIKM